MDKLLFVGATSYQTARALLFHVVLTLAARGQIVYSGNSEKNKVIQPAAILEHTVGDTSVKKLTAFGALTPTTTVGPST